jgi:hypothetical protein
MKLAVPARAAASNGGSQVSRKGPFRDIGPGVVAAALGSAVGAEVLGRGHDRVGRGQVAALEPADLRCRERAAEERVFARALDDPAPAGVAGDVDHRREGPVEACRARLSRGDARGALRVRRVPRGGHRQRNREDRAVAVDHVHAEQQRNAEPAFLDRDALQLAQRPGPGDVEVRADFAAADPLELVRPEPRIERALAAAHALDQLADLFGGGHPREQRLEVDLGRARSCRRVLREKRLHRRERGGKQW